MVLRKTKEIWVGWVTGRFKNRFKQSKTQMKPIRKSSKQENRGGNNDNKEHLPDKLASNCNRQWS